MMILASKNAGREVEVRKDGNRVGLWFKSIFDASTPGDYFELRAEDAYRLGQELVRLGQELVKVGEKPKPKRKPKKA